jgi:hypothetical protein
MQAVQIAVGTANPDYPDLAKYGEAGVLQYWQSRARTLAAAGEVIRGPLLIQPSIEMYSGDNATISDCYDDRGWQRYNEETSQLLPGKVPKPPLFVRADLVRSNGIWKVRETLDLGRGMGKCEGL